MKKINNKSKNYGFKLLAILAFVLIFVPFNQAMAAPTFVPGHFNPDNSYTFGDFYWPQSTPTVNTNTNVGSDNSSNDNNLAANAIFGSNGFMPSGLMQWILFGILVLLIVILVRKIYGADKKYHATPMKHK